MFVECIDEPIARVTLVVAPPGIGKSRLQRELVGRLERRADPPAVWLGLVDPLMQGAAHALAGDLFRRVLDLKEGTPATERRARLLARLANVPERDRVARFLGEIVDAPAEDNELVRAARRNPSVMAAQIQLAAADFIVHELTRGPIVLVLEDVHWADAASLRLVSAMIKRAKDLPLMVVALARPTVDELHPKLWEEHGCHRITLEPLLRKAAERLARAVLGEDADVDAVVQRAQGNALFVEELARARAQGVTSDLPLTIAAAAEARLSTLAAEARQALRAASIFGERFWRGAVAHLVGPRVAALLDTHLDAIEEAELAAVIPSSRFAGEREYLFRHALVRDAAYAMLTDADRTLGHSLAADWLEPRVDDAALLAQHFESGGRREKAAAFWTRAAQQALAADELDTVLAHAARAESLGADGELLGRIRLLQADAEIGHMSNVAAVDRARAALSLLPRGSDAWFTAIGIGSAASGKLGEIEVLFRLVDLLESEPARDEATGRARAISRVRAAIQVAWCGAIERAHALLDTCTEEPGAASDLALEAWRVDAAFELAFASGETMHPSECRRAQELYTRIGDRRGALTQTGNEVITLLSIGCFDEADALIEEKTRTTEGSNVSVVLFYAKTMSAAWREASLRHNYDLLIELTESATARASPRSLVANKMWLALMLLPSGRDAQSKALVEDVLDLAQKSPAFLAVGYAVLARIAHKEGDLDRALDLVLRAVETTKRGIVIWGAAFVDLVHIDLLEAHGRREEARKVLESALERVERRSKRLGEYAATYLRQGSYVAELLARRQSV